MSLHAFQRDQAFVTQALQDGEFDYSEIVGTVEETEFFRMLLGDAVLQRLARDYPSPRKKHEVPLWLYLASELTLRLHGAIGFGGYPYVLHCGGLISALGPEQVQSKRDDSTGETREVMKGYNGKNLYARTTPCDKDYLRKMAKDTDAQALEHWFATSVVREYKALNAFDKEGIFIADGSYLFVPLENDRYEGSAVLRFDESGHPISKEDYQALGPKSKERTELRRCYRMVTLSHTTAQKDYSLRCGVKVLPGNSAESPQLWPLVKRFVAAAGPGVMKLLLVDRGFVDGKTVARLKNIGVDTLFPLKKGMDLWEDAKALANCDGKPALRYDIPPHEPPPVSPDRPELINRREAKRQETLRKQRREAEPQEPARTLQYIEYKWIEPSRVWESCHVPVSVLLITNHYANGDSLDWALASTRTFADPLDMWKTYPVRPVVEEDHRQEKCCWDMTYFRSTSFSLVVNQVVFVQLGYSLIQIFLRRIGQNELVGRSRQRLLDALLPHASKIIVYYKNRFGTFRLHEYEELLLTLREGARRKLLGKTRRLRRAQNAAPELPWRPDAPPAPRNIATT